MNKKPPISLWQWRLKPDRMPQNPKRKTPMTVCIACISEHGFILGASDKMLTSGDIEFEPKSASTGTSVINKFTPVSRSIVAMIAGESGLQVEILQNLIRFVDKTSKETSAQPAVRAIVDLYVQFYNQIKRERAASAILAPLGLDGNSFIARQKEMSEAFVKTVSEAIVQFQLPPVETIIAGTDDTGPHLYKLIDNQEECCDLIGFAAIGSGARHAEFPFMLRGYSVAVPQEEALWLTYLAKRKAEIAPGVGMGTDLFGIDAKGGRIKSLNLMLDGLELDKLYQKFESQEDTAYKGAQNKIKPRILELYNKIKTSLHKDPLENPENKGENKSL